ncbi:MAG: hypothetical protein HYW78_02745 [Parcubacteria group bacterium]|nr:hypothetical protein [Parcubacteria group bacterium]
MSFHCTQIKIEYETLQKFADEFVAEYLAVRDSGDFTKAKQMKKELKRKRDALRDALWPFEALSHQELKKQYENQRNLLQRLNILQKVSNGSEGIQGIDGKEYEVPSYEEINRSMRKSREWLKTKTDQGFIQLLIVPFGLLLDDLIEKYKQVILQHHRNGTLLATKENQTDPDELLELNESQPVWVWGEYANADVNDNIVYFPKAFASKHHGKTKKEVLQENGGWTVLFVENLPNIPRQGKGIEIKGRKQLETGKTPNKYLKTLQTNAHYKNETGMTPEEQILYAITHLEQTNQAIDGYQGNQGNGSASYQIGSYFPLSFSVGGVVPYAFWDRDHQQTGFGEGDPGGHHPVVGVRSAVRIYSVK